MQKVVDLNTSKYHKTKMENKSLKKFEVAEREEFDKNRRDLRSNEI